MSQPNRVRHNLKSSRWTVQDKLLQHRALIRLYERDGKVLNRDRRIAEKKQAKEIHKLKKDIKQDREELYNAIQGDRQLHRNMLGDHKRMQLAFQDCLPSQTIEFVEHKNFNKRKLLDRLQSTMQKKIDELNKYKLKLAELEDNVTYKAMPHAFPSETEGILISGKVQEAQIKQDAALEIRSTYRNILKILRKDRIYFDSVLNQLKMDGYYQNKCIYQATKIGQLATEYTDDRKQELDELQNAIKRDMGSRIGQLRVVKEQVQFVDYTLRHLMKKEDEIRIDWAVETQEEHDMRRDIRILKRILDTIQSIIYAPTFEGILPRFVDQNRKREQLSILLDKHRKEKVILLNKINFGKVTHSYLANTTSDLTHGYIDKKNDIRTKLEEKEKEVLKLNYLLAQRKKFLSPIQTALLHIRHICRIIRVPNEKPSSRLPEQENALKLLADIETRVMILTGTANKYGIEIVDNALPELEVDKEYQKFISHISSKNTADEREPLDSIFTLEITMIDPKIHTTASIKKESRRLVEQNAIPEWMR